MRLANIEVGKYYAIGAPNSAYMVAFRAKVIACGVHGEVSQTWHSYQSSKANYVELETEADTQGTYAYLHRTKDGKIWTGRNLEGTTQSVRALASHILMEWDDYVEEKSQKDTKAARLKVAEESRRAAQKRLQEDLAQFGIDVILPHLGNSDFIIFEPDLKKVLKLLEGTK